MRNIFSKRLKFELLERREVFSGNVVATVDVNGHLIITGDEADNYVTIWQDNNGDFFVGGGRQLINGTPVVGTETTVNGQLTPQTFTGDITWHLQVYLEGGNDFLEVTNAGNDLIGRYYRFNGGSGDDTIIFSVNYVQAIPQTELNDGSPVPRGPLNFIDNIWAEGGIGDDTILFDAASTFAGVSIDSDTGNNLVAVVGNGPWHIGGLLFLGRGGNFTNNGIEMEVAGGMFFEMDTIDGTDTLIELSNVSVTGDIDFRSGFGNDTFSLENASAANADFQFGWGDDALIIDDLTVNNLTVELETDDDRASHFQNITATGNITINAGEGDDVCPLNNITADSLTVSMGDGHDATTAFNVTANTAIFDMGANFNVIGVYNVQTSDLTVRSEYFSEGYGELFNMVVGSSTISDTLSVTSGYGMDNILLGSVTAPGTVNINTGADNLAILGHSDYDGIIILYSTLGNVTVNSGRVSDILGFYDSVFDNLDLLLGDGIDQLWLGNVTVNNNSTLNGEEDGATLTEPLANSLGNLSAINFI